MKSLIGCGLVAVAGFALSGCDQVIDQLTQIEVTATSESEVQGSPIGSSLGPIDFGGDFANFDITQTTAFEDNGIGRSDIGDSYVTRFELEVTSEEDDDLSFIDGMEVYFDDDDQHDPNNDSETLVAYIESGDEPTDGQRTISLTVEDESDIGHFLRQQTLYVHVDASGNPPPDDVTIEAEMDVLVNLEW